MTEAAGRKPVTKEAITESLLRDPHFQNLGGKDALAAIAVTNVVYDVLQMTEGDVCSAAEHLEGILGASGVREYGSILDTYDDTKERLGKKRALATLRAQVAQRLTPYYLVGMAHSLRPFNWPEPEKTVDTFRVAGALAKQTVQAFTTA